MNFRSCKYFLTVCEMGTINAAARKLYISQQSLSQHIRRMEEEVGAQLFHRDNPLTLTEAGRCVQRAAKTVLEAMQRMDEEIAAYKGTVPNELIIGLLDYGTPEFLPPLIDLFLKKEPDVLFQTREIMPGEPLPGDVPLFISARELGGGYKSEVLFADRLCICVSESLLKRVYGAEWKIREKRLEEGDLASLEGCPFLRHRNTPLQSHQDMAFAHNAFEPNYLPVLGSVGAFSQLCDSGQAAMLTFLGQAELRPREVGCYLVRNVPETIPTVFICYRQDRMLSGPSQRFLEITRRYFEKKAEQGQRSKQKTQNEKPASGR